MKTRRLQFKYRKSASKLHRAVGDCLRASKVFQNYEIYQEYPVVNVNSSYQNTSHHFDWVIPIIKVVIECHGAQHFKPVAWDGDQEAALLAFQEGQSRDKAKKTAALEAGYTYVMIPYTTKNITEALLIESMKLGTEETEPYNRDVVAPDQAAIARKKRQKEERNEYLQSDRHKEELRKAREYRHERYRKLIRQTKSS